MKRSTKGPVKIGQSTDSSQWRCKTCKFLNDKSLAECRMCQDEKQIYRPQSIPIKDNKTPLTNAKPINSQKTYNPTQNNIVGLQDLKQDIGGPKVPRFNKEPEMEQYKKVAENANKKQTKSNMGKLNDKLRVQKLRNPAQFNGETIAREYGKLPQ